MALDNDPNESPAGLGGSTTQKAVTIGIVIALFTSLFGVLLAGDSRYLTIQLFGSHEKLFVQHERNVELQLQLARDQLARIEQRLDRIENLVSSQQFQNHR